MGHHRVVIIVFCKINIILSWGPIFAAHGQWMHVSCIMMDINHDDHHGRGIMYGTPWELPPWEIVKFERLPTYWNIRYVG